MQPFYTITDEELQDLREIMKTATMKTANFRKIGPDADKDDEIDALVKERTRIWRNTWIVEPLRDMIEAIEQRAGNRRLKVGGWNDARKSDNV